MAEGRWIVDGVDLSTFAYNVADRAASWNIPARKGENENVPGKHGSNWVPGKKFEQGKLSLSMWAVGARSDGSMPDRPGPRQLARDNLDRLTGLFGKTSGLLRVERVESSGYGSQNLFKNPRHHSFREGEEAYRNVVRFPKLELDETQTVYRNLFPNPYFEGHDDWERYGENLVQDPKLERYRGDDWKVAVENLWSPATMSELPGSDGYRLTTETDVEFDTGPEAGAGSGGAGMRMWVSDNSGAGRNLFRRLRLPVEEGKRYGLRAAVASLEDAPGDVLGTSWAPDPRLQRGDYMSFIRLGGSRDDAWTMFGGGSLRTESRTSSASSYVYVTETGGGSNVPVDWKPDTTYTVSVWCRLDSRMTDWAVSTPRAIRPRFYFSGGGDEWGPKGVSAPNLPGTHLVTHTFTTPSDIDRVAVALFNSGASGDRVWWDGFCIREGGRVGDYFDGDGNVVSLSGNLAYDPRLRAVEKMTANNGADVARDDTWSEHGDTALKLVSTGDDSSGVYVSNTSGGREMSTWHAPGVTYLVSVLCHLEDDVAGEGGPSLSIVWFRDGGDTDYGYAESEYVTEAGTTRLQVVFTQPLEPGRCSIRLRSGTESGAVWWDELIVSEADVSATNHAPDPQLRNLDDMTPSSSVDVLEVLDERLADGGPESTLHMDGGSVYVTNTSGGDLLITRLRPGKTYTASVWAKGADSDDKDDDVRLMCVAFYREQPTDRDWAVSDPAGTDVKRLSATFTMPTESEMDGGDEDGFDRVALLLGSGGDECWWSGVQIVEGDEPLPYFDGDTDDDGDTVYQWAGVPHDAKTVRVPEQEPPGWDDDDNLQYGVDYEFWYVESSNSDKMAYWTSVKAAPGLQMDVRQNYYDEGGDIIGSSPWMPFNVPSTFEYKLREARRMGPAPDGAVEADILFRHPQEWLQGQGLWMDSVSLVEDGGEGHIPYLHNNKRWVVAGRDLVDDTTRWPTVPDQDWVPFGDREAFYPAAQAAIDSDAGRSLSFVPFDGVANSTGSRQQYATRIENPTGGEQYQLRVAYRMRDGYPDGRIDLCRIVDTDDEDEPERWEPVVSETLPHTGAEQNFPGDPMGGESGNTGLSGGWSVLDCGGYTGDADDRLGIIVSVPLTDQGTAVIEFSNVGVTSHLHSSSGDTSDTGRIRYSWDDGQYQSKTIIEKRPAKSVEATPRFPVQVDADEFDWSPPKQAAEVMCMGDGQDARLSTLPIDVSERMRGSGVYWSASCMDPGFRAEGGEPPDDPARLRATITFYDGDGDRLERVDGHTVELIQGRDRDNMRVVDVLAPEIPDGADTLVASLDLQNRAYRVGWFTTEPMLLDVCHVAEFFGGESDGARWSGDEHDSVSELRQTAPMGWSPHAGFWRRQSGRSYLSGTGRDELSVETDVDDPHAGVVVATAEVGNTGQCQVWGQLVDDGGNIVSEGLLGFLVEHEHDVLHKVSGVIDHPGGASRFRLLFLREQHELLIRWRAETRVRVERVGLVSADLSGQPRQSGNLASNWDYKQGLQKWRVIRTPADRVNRAPAPAMDDTSGMYGRAAELSVDDTWSQVGGRSVLVTPDGSGTNSACYPLGTQTRRAAAPFVPGASYTVSAWCHLEYMQESENLAGGDDPARSIVIRAVDQDDGSEEYVAVSGQADNQDGSTRLSVTFEAPMSPTVLVMPKLVNGSDSRDDLVWWDGLLIEETDNVNPYFDGGRMPDGAEAGSTVEWLGDGDVGPAQFRAPRPHYGLSLEDSGWGRLLRSEKTGLVRNTTHSWDLAGPGDRLYLWARGRSSASWGVRAAFYEDRTPPRNYVQNSTPVPSDNLAANLGTHQTGGSSRATIEFSDEWVKVSDQSVKIVPTGGGNDSSWWILGDVYKDPMGVYDPRWRAGREYTVSVWMHLEEEQQGDIRDTARRLDIVSRDETDTIDWAFAVSGQAPNEAGTTRLSATFTKPDHAVVSVRVRNGSDTTPVWVDGLQIEEAGEPSEYFDDIRWEPKQDDESRLELTGDGGFTIVKSGGGFAQWELNSTEFHQGGGEHLAALQPGIHTLGVDVKQLSPVLSADQLTAELRLYTEEGVAGRERVIKVDVDPAKLARTEWTRFWVADMVPADILNDDLEYMRVALSWEGDDGDYGTVGFRHVKLERGEEPTPWVPSLDEGGPAADFSYPSTYRRVGASDWVGRSDGTDAMQVVEGAVDFPDDMGGKHPWFNIEVVADDETTMEVLYAYQTRVVDHRDYSHEFDPQHWTWFDGDSDRDWQGYPVAWTGRPDRTPTAVFSRIPDRWHTSPGNMMLSVDGPDQQPEGSDGKAIILLRAGEGDTVTAYTDWVEPDGNTRYLSGQVSLVRADSADVEVVLVSKTGSEHAMSMGSSREIVSWLDVEADPSEFRLEIRYTETSDTGPSAPVVVDNVLLMAHHDQLAGDYPDYFDGDTSSAVWDGEPDDSTSTYYAGARVADVEVVDEVDIESSAGGTRAEFQVEAVIPDVFWTDVGTIRQRLETSEEEQLLTLDQFGGSTAPIEDAVITLEQKSGTGPSSFRLFDEETGDWLLIKEKDLEEGERLEVDCGRLEVHRVDTGGGRENVSRSVTRSGDSRFLALTPQGADAPGLRVRHAQKPDGVLAVTVEGNRKFLVA